MLQAHKLRDKIHDIDLSTMDAKTIGEVCLIFLYNVKNTYEYVNMNYVNLN